MKETTLNKRLIAALPAIVLTVGVAGPAMAADYYYSKTAPLKALEDGVSQAEMYGKFSIDRLTYARNDTGQRDPRPGGDSIYLETFYNYNSPGDAVANEGAVDSSKKTSSKTWYYQSDYDDLDGGAERVRISTNVCEDHGRFYKDPCSKRPSKLYSY